MTETTRLERTIIHWEELLANAHSGEPMQITSNDCPLCDYYYDGSGGCTNCEDETCPIAVETGETDCNGSPWHAVNQSLEKAVGVGWGKCVPTPKTIPAVEAELAFLKSLPDPETEN